MLSSVRRGARPDGEAGPRRETQPLRSGSAAEATSCKRLVISGRNAANEPEIKPPRAEHCSLSSRHGGTLQKQSCCKPPQQEGAQGGTAPAWCPPPGCQRLISAVRRNRLHAFLSFLPPVCFALFRSDYFTVKSSAVETGQTPAYSAATTPPPHLLSLYVCQR